MQRICVSLIFMVLTFWRCNAMGLCTLGEVATDCMPEISLRSLNSYGSRMNEMREVTSELKTSQGLSDDNFLTLLSRAAGKIDDLKKIGNDIDDPLFLPVYRMSTVEHEKYLCISEFSEIYDAKLRVRLKRISESNKAYCDLLNRLDAEVYSD